MSREKPGLMGAFPGGGTGNEIGGTVGGPVVQAGSISGGVYIHTASAQMPVPRQLPPVSSYFVGRSSDMGFLNASWSERVEQGSAFLTVVHGSAGVGKTSLALRWLLDHRDLFPDGELYADLQGHSDSVPMSSNGVLASFLRALGVAPDRIPAEQGERVSLWRSMTAGRRLAVLLDNAYSAAQVRPLIAGSGRCVTVVTSRRSLTGLAMDGALFWRVGLLHPDAAVDLLGRAVGVERIADDMDAARVIVRSCACLPLAICVAAARLVSRPRWSVARMAQVLTAGGKRLENLVVDEDEAVRVALDDSYRALPSDVARLYRALGACPVSWFDKHVVAAMLTCDPDTAEDLISDLAEACLVEDLEGRYRLHDLVQEHAHRCALAFETPDRREETSARVVDFYLHAATLAEGILSPTHRNLDRTYRYPVDVAPSLPTNEHALDWLATHRTNLMQVLRYAIEQGNDQQSWQLVDAMWPMFLRLWYLDEWIEAHRFGLAAAQRLADRVAEGRMLTSGASGMINAGLLDEAERWFEQALELFEGVGDTRGEAQAHNELAQVYLRRGQFERAEASLRIALRLRGRIGYERGVALSQLGLAEVAVAAGRLEQAAERFQKAYDGLIAVDDAYDASWAIGEWARVTAALGDSDGALAQLDQALAGFAATGFRHGEAMIHEKIAQIHADNGDRQAAHAHYVSALNVLEQIGAPDAVRLREQIAAIDGGGHPGVQTEA